MSKQANSTASAQSPTVVTADDVPPQLDHPALRDTDSTPTSSYEEALLREYFGEPDDNGVYGGCEE
jgi:hypothetical protein